MQRRVAASLVRHSQVVVVVVVVAKYSGDETHTFLRIPLEEVEEVRTRKDQGAAAAAAAVSESIE